MDKEIIIYRVIDRSEIKELLKSIDDAGIRHKSLVHNNYIITENVVIKLVVIPLGSRNIKYVRGMIAVGCYGLDMESEDYLTRGGGNACKEYPNIIDYLKSKLICNSEVKQYEDL